MSHPAFTAKTLSFLRSLKRNNDRAWFHARREQYDTHVRGPMVEVIERLADDFRTCAPEFEADVKRSLFRPFRDTRFSDNKAPLKTHIGARFPHRVLGRLNGAGLYFEVAPGWVWIGGGMWAPETPQLQAIREHIADHHRELTRIVTAPAFKKLGGLKGDCLTRVPRGFAKDHPAARYLVFRQFMGVREEACDFATRADFYKHLLATFKAFVPLCRFLNEPLLKQANVLMFPIGDHEQHSARQQRIAAHQQLLHRRARENAEGYY
jgi:uncharacterized protein (TIGR02453 family)